MKRRFPIWNSEMPRPVERQYRVSLCTTCMGRLHDLEQTLPVNLKLNAGYPGVEFVVLDYNSTDGLEDWMRRNRRAEIESGLVAYYRTTEPRFYSMTHSRNVAFKLATGDIVCNVDADNLTLDPSTVEPPAMCFAERLNFLANQIGRRVFFAKSKQLMKGRLGFFRDEFVRELGGYDEELTGYGRDDHDLRDRAWSLGYTLMRFDGPYIYRFKTPADTKGANMENKQWRQTERQNAERSAANIAAGRLRANDGKEWGKARVRKNFAEWIEI
jgi:hypothetical protein